MKCMRAYADGSIVMDTKDTLNPSADRSSTDQQVQSPSGIDSISLISASELIKLIESGQGTDVNELVNKVIHDRQAA